MNGGIVFIIILVVAVAALLLLAVIGTGVLGNGVRRKEFEKIKAQRDLAYDAIEQISEACEEYKEIDHPLASKLAPLVSEFKKKEWELRK